MTKSKSGAGRRVVADNRKARYNYFIDETLEAGIQLTGSEVKSLRAGQANIAESYAAPENGELYLVNAYIPEYAQAGQFNNHQPRRRRKLLVHRRELARLMGQVRERGVTLVPIALYFNPHGLAKLEIAVGRGKKLHDKRETKKERSWEREKGRLLRDKG